MASSKPDMKALAALKDQSYAVLDGATANTLIEAGYAQPASIDPAPKDGIAVNITSRGRGALAAGDKAPAEPAQG